MLMLIILKPVIVGSTMFYSVLVLQLISQENI